MRQRTITRRDDAEAVQPARIRLLGDPVLRERTAPVSALDPHEFVRARDALHATLAEFRRQHGFGRAMAAPQIGVPYRFIAANLGEGPLTLVDPEITWRSETTLTLWDDCMSFPDLLVKVRRHRSITVAFTDESGARREMRQLDAATSELLQHEIDHLDGVLAIDLAIDRDSLVSREVYEADRDRFARQVDFTAPAPSAGAAG